MVDCEDTNVNSLLVTTRWFGTHSIQVDFPQQTASEHVNKTSEGQNVHVGGRIFTRRRRRAGSCLALTGPDVARFDLTCPYNARARELWLQMFTSFLVRVPTYPGIYVRYYYEP